MEIKVGKGTQKQQTVDYTFKTTFLAMRRHIFVTASRTILIII